MKTKNIKRLNQNMNKYYYYYYYFSNFPKLSKLFPILLLESLFDPAVFLITLSVASLSASVHREKSCLITLQKPIHFIDRCCTEPQAISNVSSGCYWWGHSSPHLETHTQKTKKKTNILAQINFF